MAKKTGYKCTSCGKTYLAWEGKCSNCGEWGTIEEYQIDKSEEKRKKSKKGSSSAQKLKDIKTGENQRFITGIGEFDRVLGGGIVKDSVSILTAKPGSGKSTMLLELARAFAGTNMKILYVSGEESSSQIKSRAVRMMDELPDNIWILSTNSMDEALDAVTDVDPDLVFFDSIQTFSLEEYSSRQGSPIQTVESTNKILEICKNNTRPRAAILIGHMTKADEMAGLRTLEHMVDTVLYLQSDLDEDLRILSSSKNRFGSTGEIGIFKMGERGLSQVKDSSKEFISQRDTEIAGSSLAMVKEGSRHLAVEIESLVSQSFQAYPIRIAQSLNKDRLNTLVAILEQRAGIQLYDKNVIVKTTGGLSLRQLDSDLGILMSIVSSSLNKAIDPSTVFLAEVGLTGELKGVKQLNQRLEELKRLGYKRAFYSGRGQVQKDKDFEAYGLRHIQDVIKVLFS